MPQIWPMNWVLLFLLFSSIFIVFVISMYFFILPTNTSEDSKKYKTSSSSLPWSW
nr:ATP synthase F0 subunit 8 [Sida crystallina]